MGKNNENFDNGDNIKRVAEQTNMTERNVERTYLHNKYGINKSKHLRVLSLGAICTEEDVSEKELRFGIDVAKKAREL